MVHLIIWPSRVSARLVPALLLALLLLPAAQPALQAYDEAPTPVRTSSVRHPEWSYNAALYEVNIRQYTPQGTFRAFRQHLPRLRDLGVDILWLMPIHPIGERNRKGSLGSYYSVQNYLTVNPEFGTLEDFQELVQAIHAEGMYVIIDWVANHTAWDNPLLEEHPEWFTRDDSGRFVSPVPDWHDVVDLNYDVPELREYMIGAMLSWVEDTDIDGFRCDVAGMVPIEFWEQARAELERVKPVFMLAEDEHPIQHRAAFDATYSWTLHGLMRDIALGRRTANNLAAYFERDPRMYPPDAFRMHFTDNHDENSWNGTVFERMGPGVETFAVLTLTAPGIPMIYTGQEAGLDKPLAFFEKDQVLWKDHEYEDLYATLLELKAEHRALWNGAQGGPLFRVPTTGDSAVFAFLRERDGDRVLTLLNLSGTAQRVTLVGPEPAGEYVDAFTGERLALAVSTAVELEPWGYRVLVR